MNNSRAALLSAAIVRCLSLVPFHTAAWSVSVFQFVLWVGRHHLGWKATLTSALQLDASSCFCVPRCPLPLTNLPVCVNKVKVNWDQAKCPRRACSSLEKNRCWKSNEASGTSTQQSDSTDPAFRLFWSGFWFSGTEEWHTETTVKWEDSCNVRRLLGSIGSKAWKQWLRLGDL